MANGILVIDKAQDWTSMDVCARLRRCLRYGAEAFLNAAAEGPP